MNQRSVDQNQPLEPVMPPAGTPQGATPKALKIELLIVLGLSLGQSGVYSIVSLIDKMTRGPWARRQRR